MISSLNMVVVLVRMYQVTRRLNMVSRVQHSTLARQHVFFTSPSVHMQGQFARVTEYDTRKQRSLYVHYNLVLNLVIASPYVLDHKSCNVVSRVQRIIPSSLTFPIYRM